MCGWRWRAALLLSMAVSVRPGMAQSQQQADRCADTSQTVPPDEQIDACTAAIGSGRWSGAGLAWAYNNRSLAYILRGDSDRAIADADEAIRLDPNDAAAFNNRGNGYREKGEYDRATADYTETIRIDPTYALAFKNRGSTYQHQAISIGRLPITVRRFSSSRPSPWPSRTAPALTRRRAISIAPSPISVP